MTCLLYYSTGQIWSTLSVRFDSNRVYLKSFARTAIVLDEGHLTPLCLHNFLDLPALGTYDEHRLKGLALSILCVIFADFRCHTRGGAWVEKGLAI